MHDPQFASHRGLALRLMEQGLPTVPERQPSGASLKTQRGSRPPRLEVASVQPALEENETWTSRRQRGAVEVAITPTLTQSEIRLLMELLSKNTPRGEGPTRPGTARGGRPTTGTTPRAGR